MSRDEAHEHRRDVHRRLDALEQDVRRLRSRMDAWYVRFTALEQRRTDMMHEVAAIISHTVIACVLIAAAVTLTITGHDAAIVWASLGTYVLGAGVQKVAAPHVKP